MLSCHITRKIPNKMTGFVSGLKHTKNCLYLQNISKRWNDYWTLCSLLIFWLFHVHAAATKNWIPDRNHWLKRLFAGRKLKMQKTEFGFMIVFNMAMERLKRDDQFRKNFRAKNYGISEAYTKIACFLSEWGFPKLFLKALLIDCDFRVFIDIPC